MISQNKDRATLNLGEELSRYFQARELIGDADLAQAYRLRYQVFCLEREFLDPQQYPRKMETDLYDAASLHFGIFLRRNRQLVATARLVSWSENGFPFQKRCNLHSNEHTDTFAGAEISRLVVARNFRRRSSDGQYSIDIENRNDLVIEERRLRNPVILLGLFREIYRGSKTHGIKTWYAAMEPALQRHLRRLFVEFEQIGPLTDYYGKVAPYRAEIVNLEKRVANGNPEMYEAFQ